MSGYVLFFHFFPLQMSVLNKICWTMLNYVPKSSLQDKLLERSGLTLLYKINRYLSISFLWYWHFMSTGEHCKFVQAGNHLGINICMSGLSKCVGDKQNFLNVFSIFMYVKRRRKCQDTKQAKTQHCSCSHFNIYYFS